MLTKEGQLLRNRRVARNLEQKELAAMAKTAQSQISRIERGQVRPSIKTLEKLFSAMGDELELSVKKPSRYDSRPRGTSQSLMHGPLFSRRVKDPPKRKSKD